MVEISACNRCRARKRRCIYPRGGVTCKICDKGHHTCINTLVSQPRSKLVNVQALQDRVTQLENLLATKSSLQRQATKSSDAVESRDISSRTNSTRTITLSSPSGPDNHQSVIREKTLGPLQSDDGITAVGSLHGNIESQSFLSNFNTTVAFTQPSQVLPPWEDSQSLLQEYLIGFNQANPLFDKEQLVDLYDSVLLRPQYARPIELAAVYVTLAVAHRLRPLSHLNIDTDREHAHTWLRKALAMLPELILEQPTLLSCQCLVGMAVVIQRTAEPYAAIGLIALALHSMLGLLAKFLQCPEERQVSVQLKRVFWIAVIVDTDLSMRMGQWLPPTFNGLGITLPPTIIDEKDDSNLVPSNCHLISRLRIQVAQLQVRLLQVLALRPHLDMSLQYQKPPTLIEPLRVIAEDLMLLRLQEPLLQALPEALIPILDSSDGVHYLLLESSFFMTFFFVHSFQESIGPYCGNILMHLGKYRSLKFIRYVEAGRRALSIFYHLPSRNFTAIWLVIEALSIASYVLLNFLIQNPHAATFKEDLQAVQNLVEALEALSPSISQRNISTALDTIRPMLVAALEARRL